MTGIHFRVKRKSPSDVTSAPVVEMLVTSNSFSQDYNQPDNQTLSRHVTPGINILIFSHK